MRIRKNIYKITFSDYRNLADLLKEKYDFDLNVFAYSITKNRIDKFSENYNIKSYNDLVKYVSKNTFFDIFLRFLAIPTTEIFRDPEFWIRLKNKHLSKYFGTIIKIWVPDITEDDELLSLIILLYEMDLLDQSEILATSYFPFVNDKFRSYQINEKKYDYSLTNYNQLNLKNELDFYLNKNKNFYTPKQFLFENVKFRVLSLWKERIFKEEFDIVLYRNRMIYYDKRTKSVILKTLHEALKNKGLLAIGSKEFIDKSKENINFTLQEKKCSFYIRK